MDDDTEAASTNDAHFTEFLNDSTDTFETPTAAQKVLATPELLEMILMIQAEKSVTSHGRNLFLLQRVNSLFQGTVRNSPRLRELMWLPSSVEAWRNDTHEQDQSNPLFSSRFSNFEGDLFEFKGTYYALFGDEIGHGQRRSNLYCVARPGNKGTRGMRLLIQVLDPVAARNTGLPLSSSSRGMLLHKPVRGVQVRLLNEPRSVGARRRRDIFHVKGGTLEEVMERVFKQMREGDIEA